MKFIISQDKFFAGFQHSLIESGHQLYWWKPSKPTFDIFDEVQPDVIMITEITPSILKCLNENIVVIVWNKDTRLLTVGATQLQTPPMVDTHAFRLTEPHQDFTCELARVGTVDDTLRKLCYPVGQYHIKIFGDDNGGGYGVAQHLGLINHQDECILYSSALLTYVDDAESALKVLACGGCPVTVNDEIEKYAIVADNDKELSDLIYLWSNDKELRDTTSTAWHKNIFANPEHTYQYFTVLLLEHINDIRDSKK